MLGSKLFDSNIHWPNIPPSHTATWTVLLLGVVWLLQSLSVCKWTCACGWKAQNWMLMWEKKRGMYEGKVTIPNDYVLLHSCSEWHNHLKNSHRPESLMYFMILPGLISLWTMSLSRRCCKAAAASRMIENKITLYAVKVTRDFSLTTSQLDFLPHFTMAPFPTSGNILLPQIQPYVYFLFVSWHCFLATWRMMRKFIILTYKHPAGLQTLRPPPAQSHSQDCPVCGTSCHQYTAP